MEQECSCGCGAQVTIIGDGTYEKWEHPTEGGKYFATGACKAGYLATHTHKCGYGDCDELVADGHGSTCPKHEGKTVVLTRTGLGGAPA